MTILHQKFYITLNYHNHFYVFFLCYTFASEILIYYLFFCTHFHLYIRHDLDERNSTPNRVNFPSPKILGGWIKSCWRGLFSHFAKNQELGRI
jgi:hypothetical protein